jgi:hypothetical protein
LYSAGRQDDHGGSDAIREITSPDVCRVGEWNGVVQVHCFAYGLSVVLVNENDFRGQAAQKERVREGGSNVSDTDHRDPHW